MKNYKMAQIENIKNFDQPYKGKFKYHLTLREGVCLNRQIIVIWGVGQIVI